MSTTPKPTTGRHFRLSFAISLQKTRFEAVASGNITKKIQSMKEMGFDGVELAVRDPAAIDLPALKATLQRTGLTVPAIGTGQAYIEEGLSLCHADRDVRQAAITRLRGHIRLASELRAMVIIGLIRCPGIDTPVKDYTGWFEESLGACLGYASGQDVLLALEPVNRYECRLIHSVSEAAAFVGSYGHPRLRILADTFHMNIEDRSFRESLIATTPYLAHVHLADSNRRFPGSGHIDFGGIIDALGEIGYNGFISGEILPEPDEFTAMKGFVSFMRNN